MVWIVGVWIDPLEILSGSDPGDVPTKLFRYFFQRKGWGNERPVVGFGGGLVHKFGLPLRYDVIRLVNY